MRERTPFPLCEGKPRANTLGISSTRDAKRYQRTLSELNQCRKTEANTMRRKTQQKTGIFQYSQGTLEQRYENYLTFSDDGNGNDRNTGKPLKSFDEWLNS